jgi:hypothetical protein
MCQYVEAVPKLQFLEQVPLSINSDSLPSITKGILGEWS